MLLDRRQTISIIGTSVIAPFCEGVKHVNDIFQSGQRVLFKSARVMADLESSTVDFVFTSPPYWNLKRYGGADQLGDEPSYEDYLAKMNDVWEECFRVSTPSAVLAINTGNRRVKGRFYPIGMDIAARMKGWVLWDIVVWYVPNALPQPAGYIERLLDNKFEFVFIYTKGDPKAYKFHKPRVPQKYLTADPRSHKKNPNGRCLGNVVRIPAYRPPNVKQMNYHVAAFPEELVAFFLQQYTDPGDLVLDPFLGSGTTLKVCRAMERRGVGYEVDEAFTDLIASRIAEAWEPPDWRNIDLILSTNNDAGKVMSPRKPQSLVRGKGTTLFKSET